MRQHLPNAGFYQTPMTYIARQPVAAIYADGGVVEKNPSSVAGTWAWCHVAKGGEMIRRDAGYILPSLIHDYCSLPDVTSGSVDPFMVTSNLTEFYALLMALEALPESWSGAIYTDNQNAKRRLETWFSDPEYLPKIGGIPIGIATRMTEALGRCNYAACTFHLLAGHPSKEDLARGYKIKTKRAEDGTVLRETKWNVSVHNQTCDLLCRAADRQYRKDEKWLLNAQEPQLHYAPQSLSLATL